MTTSRSAGSYNYGLLEEELDREDLVRTLRCPTCGVKAGCRCRWRKGEEPWTSHTGRYNAAVKAGLVPEMAGSHG